jgi:hypothetical protein
VCRLTWRRGREVRVDAEFFIDRDGRKVRRSVRTMHSLTEDETDDLMYQASHREDPLWVEMDALMDQLFNQYPFRVRRLRKELKWLRKEARRRNLRWGR